MKNLEIVNVINGLQEFLGEEGKRVLPVKVSYAINKNLNKLISAYKVYDSERTKIVDGYEDKTEEEKLEANTKLQELLEIDNEDVQIHKVAIEDVEKCENVTYKEFTLLNFMIEEESE